MNEPTYPWVRTCQECGLKQETKPPKDSSNPTNAFLNARCKRCKSEALDLGSFQVPETEEQ